MSGLRFGMVAVWMAFLTKATAAERAHRALAGGSGAKPQLRVGLVSGLGFGMVAVWVAFLTIATAAERA